MWDVTITPSLDPASPQASLIGLVHAPTISGWTMALIPFVSKIYKIKCYKIISSGIVNTSSHILFKLDEERRTKKFSAILSILKRQKFREFFWPVPICVPIDGYTWLFI
jgi:CRISPR/Cas system endoribonuclease Cas6 (RAMP superfamily)